MAKRKRKRHFRTGKRAEKNVRCRTLVVVEQEPLRKKALGDCRRLMKALEKKRETWRKFEAEDIPAFERWMAHTFGALRTKIREADGKLREKAAWVHEIDMEVAFTGCQRHTAYRRVKERFEAPPEAMHGENSDPSDDPFDENPFWEEDFDGEAGKDAKFNEDLGSRESFEAFVSEVLFMDARSLPKAAYEDLYRKFRAEIADEFGWDEEDETEFPPDAPGEPEPGGRMDERRIKDVYRTLVRRLHPDVQADSDPQVGALWHQVQDAYAAGDLERLQTLLAMTDVLGGSSGADSTLGQLRDVAEELSAVSRALQASIRKARRDVAWGFAKRQDREDLAEDIRADLEMELAVIQDELSNLDRLLGEWSKPPGKRKRAAGRGNRRRPIGVQHEFAF
jgi:hypothetical protein